MMTLMWTGSILGALLGLAHATYVFKVVVNSGSPSVAPNYTTATYFAIWTFGLWVLLGTYVLVLWVIGAVLYGVFKTYR